MTIVMVGHKGIPSRSGGIERHVEELSTALVRRGVRVISYDRAWYVGAHASPAGVIRRWSYGFRTKHLDAISHTLSAIVLALRDKPDVIHVHGVGPSLLLPLARVLHPGTKLIATFHCVDRTHAKWGLFARAALRVGEAFACFFAHRTIAVSDALASYCLETYGCQPSVIVNGVGIPQAPSHTILGDFALTPKRFFLMATRLVPHKNVHVAMDAHRQLFERNPELAKAYPLVIAGGSVWTDAYAQSLHNQAAKQPFVHMVGERYGEQLAALQAHAACHLSISSSEGMSIALLEALAFARPVIVSDIPENTEVTSSLAPIVAAKDIEALSHAMERMALESDNARDALGQLLNDRVRERHDWHQIAEATHSVYQEVLAQGRNRNTANATV